jgi:hypothetical protein
MADSGDYLPFERKEIHPAALPLKLEPQRIERVDRRRDHGVKCIAPRLIDVDHVKPEISFPGGIRSTDRMPSA